MKKILTLIVAVTLVSVTAMVAIAENKGPEKVVLEASMGNVTFYHTKHQERVPDCTTCHHTGVEDGACRSCHDAKPDVPKAKTVFHKLCKDCHKSVGGEAPTKCKGCHVK